MKNKRYFLLTGLLIIVFTLSSCLVVEGEPSRTDMSDTSMDDGSVPLCRFNWRPGCGACY